MAQASLALEAAVPQCGTGQLPSLRRRRRRDAACWVCRQPDKRSRCK